MRLGVTSPPETGEILSSASSFPPHETRRPAVFRLLSSHPAPPALFAYDGDLSGRRSRVNDEFSPALWCAFLAKQNSMTRSLQPPALCAPSARSHWAVSGNILIKETKHGYDRNFKVR